ncbi:MAG: beta-galactosidase trimerization domain-containing protein [Planctomycetes bacterium]|nr:beta-galactosidase trimerization domain-containing protein [Planctomycetota bacterium]
MDRISKTIRRLSFVVMLAFTATAFAGVPAEKVPAFKIRFKPQAVGDKTAEKYTLSPGRSKKKTSTGNGQWSDWLKIEKREILEQLKRYPNSYSRGWPVRMMFSLRPVPERLQVNIEAQIGEKTHSSKAELIGHRLGLAIWRNSDGKPHVATLSSYNRDRYWSVLDKLNLKGPIPKKIALCDRFITGDDDLIAVREGFAGLKKLGMNVLMVGPRKRYRELARETGFDRFTWAVYAPPGYAFDFGGPKTNTLAIRKWARKLSRQHARTGFAPRDFDMYIISDEPGFYYPSTYAKVNNNPRLLARFHGYLRDRGLSPADFGADSWDQIKAIGRTQAESLPERKLFYWSQRFFPHESARHLAKCNRAMKLAFHDDLPSVVNWNFFSGRCYFPGPFGNNPDKDSPDAAMAGHDWFEFCRLGGTDCPWTEDWFGDERAFQWSYYSEKLYSASTTGEFGGYVVPRVAGQMEDGVVYKIMSLIGHGARRIKFFTFGPEYNFPGNCYSQNTRVFSGLARAARLIGRGEELLHAGRPLPRRVGLLHHLSSEMWDQFDAEKPDGIVDATNTHMNARCSEYTAELFDIYLALMHSQIPVEFISEEQLSWGSIDHLKVLYVIEPNVPIEAQKQLSEWVKRGGTLVTTSAAASADRYNQSTDVLGGIRGVIETSRKRLILQSLNSVKKTGMIEGNLNVYGPRSKIQTRGAKTLASFDDGTPALTVNTIARGKAFHYSFLPGLSYRRSARAGRGKFLSGFSTPARDIITLPVRKTGVEKPVLANYKMIETPVLASEKGLAVTLLNWTNNPAKQLQLRIRVTQPVSKVESAVRGKISFSRENGGLIRLEIPLKTVDVLSVHYR